MFPKIIVCFICGEQLNGKPHIQLNILTGEKSETYSFCSQEHLDIFRGDTETEELDTDG